MNLYYWTCIGQIRVYVYFFFCPIQLILIFISASYRTVHKRAYVYVSRVHVSTCVEELCKYDG